MRTLKANFRNTVPLRMGNRQIHNDLNPFSTTRELKRKAKRIEKKLKQEDEVRKRAALKVVETEYERVVELSSDATNKYTALEKFEHFRDKMGYH